MTETPDRPSSSPHTGSDAQPLLANLGGPVAPEAWRGALPLTYHVGPGSAVSATCCPSPRTEVRARDTLSTSLASGTQMSTPRPAPAYDAAAACAIRCGQSHPGGAAQTARGDSPAARRRR